MVWRLGEPRRRRHTHGSARRTPRSRARRRKRGDLSARTQRSTDGAHELAPRRARLSRAPGRRADASRDRELGRRERAGHVNVASAVPLGRCRGPCAPTEPLRAAAPRRNDVAHRVQALDGRPVARRPHGPAPLILRKHRSTLLDAHHRARRADVARPRVHRDRHRIQARVGRARRRLAEQTRVTLARIAVERVHLRVARQHSCAARQRARGFFARLCATGGEQRQRLNEPNRAHLAPA